MKLLLDNNLSPQLRDLLAPDGFEIEHIRDHGLRAASDPEVLALARERGQVLVSADTDFGQLLYASGDHAPSVVIMRTTDTRRPAAQARLLRDNLPTVADDLRHGALVVLQDTRIRVRELPLS